MSGVEPPVATGREHGLSGLLADARGHGFVGRTEELAAFADSLAGASSVRVHLVHGPGGIGKSTLLDAFARLAAAQGLRPVYLDAKDVDCTGTAVAAAVAERSVRAGYDPEEAPDVLLLDSFELLAPLERWVREELLPARPRTSVTVVSGRDPPSAAWRLDPGWRHLARIHGLTELNSAQSADLLARLGVAAADRTVIVRIGRGHPLVLAMLAEARGASTLIANFADAPDLVAQVCRLLVDDVPDAAHRSGLATCAHATRMTADLLRCTVGSRAEEVWDWLESRPYVRRGAVGLFVHDVVREVFEAEFAQRSPDAYVALHVAVRGYFLGRLADPGEPHPDRAAAELLFLHRRGPLSEMMATLREGGLLPVARAGPEDRAGILTLIEEAEGPQAAALAGRYAAEQPGCLYRARSDDGVEAFAMQVYLPTGGPLDVDDPVAAAVLALVAERAPLRPGERVNVNRFAGSSRGYQRDPTVFLVNGVSCVLEWGQRPAAWTFIVTSEPEQYGAYFEYLGMARMLELSLPSPVVGPEPLLVVGYGWDRRRFPVPALFELMARRELSGEQGPPPPEMLRPAPLSQAAFAAAVRAALVEIGRPDRLGDSPLLGSALVPVEATDRVTALTAALSQEIRALDDERRGSEHRRVLERTYLKGAPSQEVAAQVLGLPFSTYRRHLAQAVGRLVEVLWSVEIGERPGPARR
ncbi:MAG: ATP-binding protein [Terracoccus sp.]